MKDQKKKILNARGLKSIEIIYRTKLSAVKGGGKGEHRASKTDAD